VLLFEHNTCTTTTNPNVHRAGSAAQGPVGTGMPLAGAATTRSSQPVSTTSMGVAIVSYPDSGKPCTGGRSTRRAGQGSAVRRSGNNHLVAKRSAKQRRLGNPTNGRFDQLIRSHRSNATRQYETGQAPMDRGARSSRESTRHAASERRRQRTRPFLTEVCADWGPDDRLRSQPARHYPPAKPVERS